MFTSDLNLVAIPKRPDIWYLGAPLVWESLGTSFTVPAGFITDLASIPRIVEAIPDLDVNGLARRPGALHDWLYGGARWVTKPIADLTLMAALEVEGMDPLGAKAIYEAVHLFADKAWDEDGTKSMAAQFITYDHYMDWLRTHPTLNPAP